MFTTREAFVSGGFDLWNRLDNDFVCTEMNLLLRRVVESYGWHLIR